MRSGVATDFVHVSSSPSSVVSPSSLIFGTTSDRALASSLSSSGVATVSVLRSSEELDVVEYGELEKVLSLRIGRDRSGESMPRKDGLAGGAGVYRCLVTTRSNIHLTSIVTLGLETMRCN